MHCAYIFCQCPESNCPLGPGEFHVGCKRAQNVMDAVQSVHNIHPGDSNDAAAHKAIRLEALWMMDKDYRAIDDMSDTELFGAEWNH